ncbi:MAG: type II toxin-antitoxin system toxin DNA ADP-ribosyl transferase DarT [Stellaceae bacterium]
MMAVPERPKVYHIAHVDRLPSIISDGALWCDRRIVARAGAGTMIGMDSIKRRRLALPVRCHPDTYVGDYVPFYFCSRSITLYVIHSANHSELAYRGGQEPIVHLEADLHRVIAWADANGRRWAFSLSNAGAVYAQFRANIANLGEINWPAVAATDFRSADIKEGKQAELLIHDSFPWSLVDRIGVCSRPIARQVADTMHGAAHRPMVEVRRDWYY